MEKTDDISSNNEKPANIPNISIIGFVIWNIVDATQKGLLVRKFGKSIWFVIGIIFFDFIFYPIIEFDKSEYKK